MLKLKNTQNNTLFNQQINDRLVENMSALLAAQVSNGAIDAPCGSRVLESTLALYLLRNLSYQEEKQQQIERYLIKEISGENHHITNIEKAIVMMAKTLIGSNNVVSKLSINALLNRKSGRKAIYFGCLLAETGVIRFSDLPFDYQAFKTLDQSVQTWAKVMLCSLKVIYCCGTSEANLITKEDRNFLTAKLFSTAIFENNVLTQIVGLIALSKLLPKAQLEKPIEALMNWQQPDGGLPLMTGLDNFVTPLAGLAAMEALAHLTEQYQPPVRTAINRMADYLASEQLENGGWSYMTGTTQIDMDDTGLCCALLAMVNARKFARHLHKAEHCIANMQNKDGGYPTYIKNNSSTSSMTAAILHGIAEMQLSCLEMASWRDSIQQTLSYLAASQKDDGTFEQRWSRADTHAMFRVAVALGSIQKMDTSSDIDKIIHKISDKMAHYLRTTQNADGGWGFAANKDSDVISTAYAILCCNQSQGEPAAAGLRFLLSMPHNDNLNYKPDLLGPRPVPYNIPILPLVIRTYALAYFMKVFL